MQVLCCGRETGLYFEYSMNKWEFIAKAGEEDSG
jgi:hypothetical protein